MKKHLFCIIALCATILAASCSDNDGERKSEARTAYETIQKEIIGTWTMHSYWDSSIRWWNQDNEFHMFEKVWEQYKLTFRPDGTVIDKEGKVHNYTLTLNEDYKQPGNYPLKKGYVRLDVTGFEMFNTFYIYINKKIDSGYLEGDLIMYNNNFHAKYLFRK